MVSSQELVTKVRREFNKANLDISRLQVVNYRGTISLYGWIVRAKGDKSEESVQERVTRVIERLKRFPEIRDIVNYARVRD